MTPIRLVTFDAYSGLADFRGTLLPVIGRETGLDEAAAGQLLATWRAKQLEAAGLGLALGRGRIPFRDCTALAFDYAAHRHGVRVDTARRSALIEAWFPLEPWPEANRVLAELRRRGYALAILSNGDPGMLAAIAGRVAVPFDRIYSAETARSYKPHAAVYELPVGDLVQSKAGYLHVAGGASDVLGAKHAGVACYWNNRSGDRVLFPDAAADYDRPDLLGLLDILHGDAESSPRPRSLPG